MDSVCRTKRGLAANTCFLTRLPSEPNRPAAFNVFISLVKLVIKYCNSGDTDDSFTWACAPRMEMGIMAERTQMLVREMHAQYGRWR